MGYGIEEPDLKEGRREEALNSWLRRNSPSWGGTVIQSQNSDLEGFKDVLGWHGSNDFSTILRDFNVTL